MYLLVFVAVVLWILFKVLNVNSSGERSLFYCQNAKFLEEVLKNAPGITEPYLPTRLWGFSGHVQTIIQGVLSRLYCPLVDGKRYFFVQPDGTTVTYDLYQPLERHTTDEDFTLALCPGICNSSETVYIRRVVYHAQFQGYRVAVLNHVGTLKTVPLTGQRIFSYGDTADYGGMVTDLVKRFPSTKLVCVGFSMGGNIVTKYLGEQERSNVVAGISACQGYDANEAAKYLLQWEGGRRLYLFAITENRRALLRRWQNKLFTDDVKREKGINERDVWAAATLYELDDKYSRKIENAESVSEFYHKSSCVHYMDNIKVPMVFINALDDPIVPVPLLDIVKKAVKTHDHFLYIEQKYGGHLGFYEGGFICPQSLTWLDRAVVSLSDALSMKHVNSDGKRGQQSSDQSDFDTAESGPSASQSAASSSGEDEDRPRLPLVGRRALLPQNRPKRPRFLCKRSKLGRRAAGVVF